MSSVDNLDEYADPAVYHVNGDFEKDGPFYLAMARRVRLFTADGGIEVYAVKTEHQR